MPIREARKTKIVCTIGPASGNPKMIDRLIRAGMNVARLNFSHGTHDEHREKLRIIRAAAKKLGRPVAVMQDLAGPKVRTGKIDGAGIPVKSGATVVLSGRRRNGAIFVSHPRLAQDVKVGDQVLLADGVIELRVEKIEGDLVECRVVVGGTIGSHKGVNVPSEALSVKVLTDKDRADLEFALAEEIDFIALSFVRSAEDVLRVKRIIKKRGKEVPVIAKIEKPQAVETIDGIIASSDGIMVARGDLGVEIPLEQVPLVQKMLIRKANQAGKPVITATQMMRSMVDNPRPTRAEVADVANAIWEGTDAVMLSEETAVGEYPTEAVEVMCRVAKTVERDMLSAPLRPPFPADDPIPDSISYSAYLMAENLHTRAIVAPTRSGVTARRISRYRPDPVIVALTPSVETQRRLCLSWGVVPVLCEDLHDPNTIIEQSMGWARRCLPLKKGDRIIITAGAALDGHGATDTIRLEEI